MSQTPRLHPASVMGIIFAILLSTQALGLILLGTGRAGVGFSLCILVVDSLLSFACVWIAFRRAVGITALFWFLFGVVVLVLLAPTAIQAYDTIFIKVTLSDSNRGLLYCLYGAPILMMLFLPEAHQEGRVKSEILLDLFQVGIVIGLIYTTFFFLPVQQMLPIDAALRNNGVSDAQSLLLLLAGFVRLQFARVPATRGLLLRLNLFLLVCAVATLLGDWILVHHPASAMWFDLGWAIPIMAAAFVAFTWTPSPEPQFPPEPASFLSFVGSNLALVAMLSGVALLTDWWKEAYGGALTNAAIAASLLALTLRLALTQFHQSREISQRKVAQQQLGLSHEKIAGLLEGARRQNSEILQINELGVVLQGCVSREEAFGVIPDRMERLFPGTSGTLSILNPARTRAALVAKWGHRGLSAAAHDPVDKLASRSEQSSAPGSVSIPLIARDEVIGVLFFQDHATVSNNLSLSHLNDRARMLQLASALAEHIALTLSNLDLRAALQAQAIRDPLTGLYNRRHMQEVLDRELHRARRRDLPLSLMMIDIDDFKKYNDTFGHGAGDDALRLVAETLASGVRAEDLACRYGGEEFVVILSECTLHQAALRAEAIRRRLRELYVERPGELPDIVTLSIGIAGFQETTGKIEMLLKFADDALYQAKREGRDRVVVACPESTDPHRSTRLSGQHDDLVVTTPESAIRS